MTHEIHIGEPNKECAGCRRKFSTRIAPAAKIRILFPILAIPVAFEYRICPDCLAALKAGGSKREKMLDAINAFHKGSEVSQ